MQIINIGSFHNPARLSLHKLKEKLVHVFNEISLQGELEPFKDSIREYFSAQYSTKRSTEDEWSNVFEKEYDQKSSLKLNLSLFLSYLVKKYSLRYLLILWRNNLNSSPSHLFIYDPEEKLTALKDFLLREKDLFSFEKKITRNSLAYNKIHRLKIKRFSDLDPYFIRNLCSQRDTGFSFFDSMTPMQDANLIEKVSKPKNIGEGILSSLQIFFSYFSYYYKNINRDSIFWNAFDDFSNKVLMQMSQYNDRGETVSFAYFNFLDQDKYFLSMGEDFSRDVMNDIRVLLKSRLKKKDSLFILAPDEYIIMAPNCDFQTLQRRFPEKSFHVNNFIVNFRMRVTEMNHSIHNVNEIWNELYKD